MERASKVFRHRITNPVATVLLLAGIAVGSAIPVGHALSAAPTSVATAGGAITNDHGWD